MGLDKDIIVDEKVDETTSKETGTVIEVSGIKSVKFPDKRLETISRVVVERLLPYFVDKDHACPAVVIREARDGSGTLSLRD